ncbi:MAG: thermonuclease family protein [Chloroflexi bacterium]|nr:thermonuclease family protein [Chloroflexota bacterium]
MGRPTSPKGRAPAEAAEEPRRWGRVVDVVGGGVIYTEDAERLVLAGVRWPQPPERRAEAEAFLTSLVHDKIVFYQVTGTDSLGRLMAEVWVEGAHVNNALRGRGYG